MAKNKKRRRTAELKRQAGQKKNRWNPAGRALLYIDLVLLAVSALLDANELISDFVSGLFTVAGVILLLIALWLLFGKKKGPDSLGAGPRL